MESIKYILDYYGIDHSIDCSRIEFDFSDLYPYMSNFVLFTKPITWRKGLLLDLLVTAMEEIERYKVYP